ncbi:hypothetical protein [Alterinioella nitratireducens]|uniref:hypothetical protein n=1 Tax=Rhodobacterales TaxID=204455 RepID=UPI00405931AE
MSKIVGWVGVKRNRTVTGWVADEQRLEETLCVTVSIGTWISPPIIAKEYRHHLRQRQFGTARYGFSIELPSQIELQPGNTVRVLVAGQPDAKFAARIPDNIQTPPKKIGAHQSLSIIADAGHPAREELKSLDDLTPFSQKVLESPRLAHLLRDAGRARSKVGDTEGALRLLGAALQLWPNDKESIFHYAVAASRANLDEEAIHHFKKIYPGDWRTARVLSEYIQAVRRIIEKNGHSPSANLVKKLVELVTARLALVDHKDGVLPSSIAVTLKRLGQDSLALESIEHTLSLRPTRSDAYLAKARIMIESKRVDEGLSIARLVLERWPENESAAHMLRAFRHMAGLQVDDVTISTLQVLGDSKFLRLRCSEDAKSIEVSPDEFAQRLRSGAFDWLVVCDQQIENSFSVARAHIAKASQAGYIQISDTMRLWKATAILDLLNSDIVKPRTIIDDLERMGKYYIRPAPSVAPGCALLVSRYGPIRFGGAEHFLHSAALHYKSLGYSPLLLGDIKKINHGKIPDVEPGLDYDFCEMNPETLRRIIVERNVTLIHALSGTGGLMSAAVGDMNIPFVYGVHYFREVLGGDGGEVYFDSEGAPIPRPDFEYLLSRASVVYANSTYTRDLIERAHGVRCPVIFSVPEDLQE